MQRDWQRNQVVNFSHHNWQHLNATPRTAREAFGEELQIQTDEKNIGDTIVGVFCCLVILAYIGYVVVSL